MITMRTLEKSEPLAASGEGEPKLPREMPALSRILMLVPHDPTVDPRVMWVIAMCGGLMRTDVLAAVWGTKRMTREYSRNVFIERFSISDYSCVTPKFIGALFQKLNHFAGWLRGCCSRTVRADSGAADTQTRVSAGSLLQFLWAWTSYATIICALYRRGRAVSIPPRVCICHDIFALIPAVLLKRRFGYAVLYDSHELWSEDDLFAEGWQKTVVRWVERPFIRRADRVVTVTPQIAKHLERVYGLPRVVVTPNAEPFDDDVIPSCRRALTSPIRFLLQGGLSRGRGIETVFQAWRLLRDERAVLYVRGVGNEFLDRMKREFADLVEAGRVIILPPVREHELVQAAAFADVGIIPYPGPNLNHLYACPNKLSQYMHAGLAVLSNDLEYVSAMLRKFKSGMTYDAHDPSTMTRTITQLVDDQKRLQVMKENAYAAAKDQFNWRHLSVPYREAIVELARTRN
jgi:glycosyltransferase involved in cell wall biosynthesis